jgi:hypothetical protein
VSRLGFAEGWNPPTAALPGALRRPTGASEGQRSGPTRANGEQDYFLPTQNLGCASKGDQDGPDRPLLHLKRPLSDFPPVSGKRSHMLLLRSRTALRGAPGFFGIACRSASSDATASSSPRDCRTVQTRERGCAGGARSSTSPQPQLCFQSHRLLELFRASGWRQRHEFPWCPLRGHRSRERGSLADRAGSVDSVPEGFVASARHRA